jgi:hypothetical protein
MSMHLDVFDLNAEPFSKELEDKDHQRLVIDPLTPEATADYVRARLAKAGCQRDIFASDAIAIVHEATGGALREIDRIATTSLRAAARRTRKTVERDVVARIVKATMGERPHELTPAQEPGPGPPRHAKAGFAVSAPPRTACDTPPRCPSPAGPPPIRAGDGHHVAEPARSASAMSITQPARSPRILAAR